METKNSKPKKTKSTSKSILELVPVRWYSQEDSCFRLTDGNYMDILQIQSKDLINSSEDEVEFDCLKFAKAYRLYADDMKIICLNFPCDYSKQKHYLEYKMKKTKNEIFKEQLLKKKNELEWLEKNNTTREYYYMIFAKTAEEMEKNRLTLLSTLGRGRSGLIEKISKEKKEQILLRLYNKSNLVNG